MLLDSDEVDMCGRVSNWSARSLNLSKCASATFLRDARYAATYTSIHVHVCIHTHECIIAQ